jgi:enediyne biosynthesis protein E4
MRSLALAIVLALIEIPPSKTVTFRQIPPSVSGIHWVHTSAHSEHRYLPETIPPGVAIFDYNNDGLMDILFTDSGESTFFRPAKPLHPVLYRNNGDGTFTDVSEKAGLTADFFGMGVAVGDYDGDGFEDLFLTGYGRSILYHNNGNGTFTDVTAQSGINAPGWSTSAVWFDYNNDGKLDLYVAQFVDYSSLKTCGLANSYGGKVDGLADAQSYYCIPRIFNPMPGHLYRNNGGGHFTDVSREMGLLASPGKGFGVVATDINNDGFMDLFQANDTVANFLFVNRGGKKFDEVGLQSGVGYSDEGLPRSGMGVDAADFDGDGRQDLFVANVDQETFSIYHNNGDETFNDTSKKAGIADPTRLLSGWGLRFFDYDNDGLVDLILANGHPDDLVDKRMRAVTYKEPLLLFHNDGDGRMRNVSAASGEAFQATYAARGLAVGDLNNDGYPDVVVGINGGAPLVLYNNAESKNHWVGLKLVGTEANRDAVGAVIRWCVNGQVHSRLKTAGGSFMSSHDPREVLGIGPARRLDWVEVQWPKPGRGVERLENVPIDRYVTVVEGRGVVDK